ncbi:MAG TPA: HEAT repeat domain-containing protein, partial [Polyangiaceae bacterium]
MVRSFALSMSTWFKGVVVAIALAVAPSAVAESSEAGLVKELRGAPDFRVRVQAALQLGKLKSDGARTALEAALNDKEESVRAAAAGGLKKIGDKRSLAALQRHREDESEAVQRQVADALKSLGGAAKSAKKPKLLVQLGDMQNTTAVKSEKALQALRETSRQKLDELPEVGVVDTAPKSSEGKLPVVLMTGRIERLKMSRDGSDVIYSARVEYILYRMPGR